MQIKTIAFYNWTFPDGGAETVTYNLGRFFRSQNFRLIVYTRHLVSERITKEMRETFDILPLPDSNSDATPANTQYLCESLKNEQVDIFIVQGVSYLPFRAIRETTTTKIIFCLHNIPFWEVEEWKHKKASSISRPTLMRKIEFLLLRKPINALTNKLKNQHTRTYTQLLTNIDRFISLCPDYQHQFEQHIRQSTLDGANLPANRFGAILNPLLPPQEPTKIDKEKILLYVGRLHRVQKRTDRLLHIWHRIEKQHPDWRLILVGDGEERNNLEKLTRDLNIQRVEFAGYQQDVTPYYRRASFVCLTSNFEGLPMCLMEGQQYGAIPVSFDSYAGIREITNNGECGILVPSYSKRKYAQMLSAVLTDEDLQQQMREKCYQAAKNYDLDHIGAQWLQLFKTL